jgi:hypothetical protein
MKGGIMGKKINKGSKTGTFVASAFIGASLVLGGPAAALAGGIAMIGGYVVGRAIRAAFDNRKRKPKGSVNINTRLNSPPSSLRIDEIPPTTIYTYPDPTNRQRAIISINRYGEIFQR